MDVNELNSLLQSGTHYSGSSRRKNRDGEVCSCVLISLKMKNFEGLFSTELQPVRIEALASRALDASFSWKGVKAASLNPAAGNYLVMFLDTTRIWTHALGSIFIPGKEVYPWTAFPLKDYYGLFHKSKYSKVKKKRKLGLKS
ncbi:hypothetical protein F2Q70_00030778 [Brassica cretica]|uniref:Uncharacterized protein n=1 Tax=Brassica cretica TaxID=69181 RepID=A0A8S9FF82_BRACR|nr:hypothetical protein F2Q70_00030778 [Brassica cretica]